MTPSRLIAVVKDHGTDIERNEHVLKFKHEGINLILVFDEVADRMRIIAPICELKEAAGELLERALEANFHSVLDARYAISNGIVWSAFIHPLSDLTERLLVSAMTQVARAKATFGGEFTSGALVFGE